MWSFFRDGRTFYYKRPFGRPRLSHEDDDDDDDDDERARRPVFVRGCEKFAARRQNALGDTGTASFSLPVDVDVDDGCRRREIDQDEKQHEREKNALKREEGR